MKLYISIPEDLKLINNVFKNHNHEVYLVGGSVRDAILNQSIKDYDLVTDALPDRVIELLQHQHFVKNILETGKQFGIVNVITENKLIKNKILRFIFKSNIIKKIFKFIYNRLDKIILDNNEYEVATFRADAETGDGRRPDSVTFCDMKTDALRRDLTFNALYYNLETEEVIDLVSGIEDLNNKIIRTVGNAEDRFNEDKLRILRAIRFAARFGSELHSDIHHTLLRDSDLSKISNERIRDEFIKGLKSAKSQFYFLDLIRKYDLYQYIFKGLEVIDYNIAENFNYIIVIAYMLKENNDLAILQSKLNRLTYSIDEIKMIKFLINLKNLNSDNVYLFKKQQNNCKINNEQILKFGQLTYINEKLLEAFIDYNLTITGEEIMNSYQVQQGKEVGIMMEALEIQLFKQLLEKKQYEKGFF